MGEIRFGTNLKPDFERLLKLFNRKAKPDRVPFFELSSDIDLEHRVLEKLGLLKDDEKAFSMEELNRAGCIKKLKKHFRFMQSLGFDYGSIGYWDMNFRWEPIAGAKGKTEYGEREYVQAETARVKNYNDFEKYPWPEMDKIDYSLFENIEEYLPEGMKIIAWHSGVLESVLLSFLGLERISYTLYDNKELVKDIIKEVAIRLIKYFDIVSSFDIVGAVTMCEDMGFKTHTMLSPEMYRELIFPWHKKIVNTIHKNKKIAILHTCGNMRLIMEDIISCGWDARHSFEDSIEPVWEAMEKYGDRISMLGGFDVDKLTRMNIEEVREHTRFLINKCASRGNWALGSGNSVANYINIDNYLAMLREGYSS